MDQRVTRYIGIVVIAVLFAGGMMFLNEDTDVTGKPKLDRQLENIEAFGRLYGAVRYFHPSDEAAEIDWTRFAVYGVGKVKNARNEKKLKEELVELFLPIAPTLVIYKKDEEPEHPMVEKTMQVLAWQHYGPPGLDTTYFSSKRVSGLVSDDKIMTGDNKLFDDFPAIHKKINRQLSEGLRYSLPVVLYQKNGQTIGSTTKSRQGFKKLKDELLEMDSNMTTADENVRLAGVIVTWNQLSYFHPHIGRPAGNLDDLGKSIKNAFDDETREDYFATLTEMMEWTDDGHAMSSFNKFRIVGSRIPLEFDIVEGKLTITAVGDAIKAKRGDIVERIYGQDALGFIKEGAANIPGSPQFKLLMAIDYLLFQDQLKLTINRDGTLHNVDLTPGYGGFVDEYGHKEFQELEPGVFYIDLSRNVFQDIQDNMDELSKAKGIVFDMRGGIFTKEKVKELFGHLTQKPVQGAQWAVRQTTVPGENMATFDGGHDTLQSLEPFFSGKIVFLASRKTYGASEQLLSFVKSNKLGEIVGMSTAGIPGDPQVFPIPGSIQGIMTGVEVSLSDGTPIYGVGIKEDFTVIRTFDGVKAGRDEYLLLALGLIQ
ncbi:hypothetical protein A8F94_15790 [Bacillus sp. FJAT-27225]|uniref:S41 family peptidase n=1 Tax=Bacillus sp. FJAT-27225 TaxID=1743144 RepID=UPI00080C2B49|nr:S41 family peptidase [Bacillus sp. FJAT-27225]OCA84181.1 hypothetical protein A8F94_15790 [Bacillus sp. FJAT-27225]